MQKCPENEASFIMHSTGVLQYWSHILQENIISIICIKEYGVKSFFTKSQPFPSRNLLLLFTGQLSREAVTVHESQDREYQHLFIHISVHTPCLFFACFFKFRRDFFLFVFTLWTVFPALSTTTGLRKFIHILLTTCG